MELAQIIIGLSIGVMITSIISHYWRKAINEMLEDEQDEALPTPK